MSATPWKVEGNNLKLYEIIIHPISGFGTPIKGDTLFGHFCWQVVYDPSLLEGGLEKQISIYQEKPFAIFSSAFFRLKASTTSYILKRPDMPLSRLFSIAKECRAGRFKNLKEKKKKKWMVILQPTTIDLSSVEFISDEELFEMASQQVKGKKWTLSSPKEIIQLVSQPHNTINRLTNTTGIAPFAPYTQEYFHYLPGIELVVFVLLNESATDIDKIHTALKRIGKWGYGKDASIGMGRFEVSEIHPLSPVQAENADACYTLAPSVPEKGCYSKLWFNPFIRYGKHGDKLVHNRNPFKNPVVMADEGAVFKPKDEKLFKKPYLGSAINNVSITEKRAVVQGYSPYIPIKNLECFHG